MEADFVPRWAAGTRGAKRWLLVKEKVVVVQLLVQNYLGVGWGGESLCAPLTRAQPRGLEKNIDGYANPGRCGTWDVLGSLLPPVSGTTEPGAPEAF